MATVIYRVADLDTRLEVVELEAVPTVDIDAAPTTSRSWRNEITRHPLESGASITDHVVNQNPTFSIQGIVSDAALLTFGDQLDALANAAQDLPNIVGNVLSNVFTTGEPIDLEGTSAEAQNALIILIKIWRDKELFTIAFSDRREVYPNCVLKSLEVKKSAAIGDSLQFNLRAEQVSFVTSRQVSVKAEVPREEVEEDAAAGTNGAQKDTSLLGRLIGSTTGATELGLQVGI